ALLAILAAAAVATVPARAESLLLTVSDDTIEVTSRFAGAGIAVVGSIEREAGEAPREAGYDLVVVVRGPKENVVTRRREKVGGIWVNRQEVRYYGVPSFYLVSASQPLEQIAAADILSAEAIGLANAAGETLSRASAE